MPSVESMSTASTLADTAQPERVGFLRQLGVDTGYTLLGFPLAVVSFSVIVTGLSAGLSTLVFRFRPDGLSEDDADRLTARIRATLYARGTAMVAATKVAGRSWLKLTLLNPAATVDHILGITDQVLAVGRELCVEAVA